MSLKANCSPHSDFAPLRYLECRTGMEHLVRMLPMIMASRSVQVPDSHSGMRIPVGGEELGTTGHHLSRQSCVV